MKKAFLASTALVGAAMIAAPAFGQSVGTADTMAVTLNGVIATQASVTDLEETNGKGRGYAFEVPEAEFHIRAENTADNGIRYGFVFEVNANGSDTTATDEAFICATADWGRIEMGNNDGAANVMQVGAMNANRSFQGTFGGVFGLSTFQSVDAAGQSRIVRDDPEAFITGDGTKVSYFSPRFSGFQVGASWTPDAGAEGAQTTDNNGDAENVLSLAANYNGNFDDVGVRASIAYISGGDESATGAEDEGVDMLKIGAVVDYAGFTIGASYRDNGDTGLTTANTAAGLDSGDWWGLGVAYGSGPWGVAAHYAAGEQMINTAGIDEEVVRYGAGLNYAMAPGWRVTADLIVLDHENINGAAGSSQKHKSFFITNMFSF